jgi:putative inorganic carbon (HCO3(-)) transporter
MDGAAGSTSASPRTDTPPATTGCGVAVQTRWRRWSEPTRLQRRVEIALLLLIVSFPLKSVVGREGLEIDTVPLISLTKLAGIWFLANFLLYVVVLRPRLGFGAAHTMLLALFAVAVISSCAAAVPSAAAAGTLRYANFIALFIALTTLFADERLQIATVWALVAACAVCAVVALAARSAVASTPFGNANDVAFQLATALPLALWLCRHQRRWWPLLVPMIAAIGAATILSFSRGAFVGLAAAVAWQRYTQRITTRAIAVVAAIAILALLAVIWMDPERARAGLEAKQKVAWANVTNRLAAWSTAIGLTVEHPLLGIGPGHFQFRYAARRDPGAQALGVVHNTFLEVAAELGAVAGLLFAGYLALTFARLSAAAGAGVGPPGLASAVRLGLIIAVVAGIFLSEQFFLPFWLFGAYAAALAAWPRRAATAP